MRQSRESSVNVFSFGFPGSGFQFYLVRCRTKKDLASYVSRLEGGAKFTAANAPYAYSYSKTLNVLDGVLPEANGTRLWVAYLIVVTDDDDGPISYRDELRHWAHEIGHTLESFAEEYTNVLSEYYATRATCVAMREPATEAVAYCSELLFDAVMLFVSAKDHLTPSQPMSGIKRVMPWVDSGAHQPQHQETTEGARQCK